MRHVDREEIPSVFSSLPPDEQRRRLRLYLVSLCSGLHKVVAWHVGLDFSDEGRRFARAIIDGWWTDGRIGRALSDAEHRRRSELPAHDAFAQRSSRRQSW
jgi:hypothetical protein